MRRHIAKLIKDLSERGGHVELAAAEELRDLEKLHDAVREAMADIMLSGYDGPKLETLKGRLSSMKLPQEDHP